MEHTPLPARLGLWRLTRHAAVRRVYDRLAAAGVFLAQLDRVVREAGPRPGGADVPTPDPSTGVTVRSAPATGTVPDGLAGAHLAPSDRVVTARRDGRVIGYCCVADRPVYVPELRRRLRVPGAYLWKLYVRPGERGHGVGTALIARAVGVAADGLDAPTVEALVAPDNVPSRRAFARLGFSPVERFTSAGCLGRTFHRRADLS